MIFSAIFSIVVGAMMIIQWTTTLLKKQVEGPEAGISGREKLEMVYHWTAEFATAVLLIVSGAGLLVSAGWGENTFLVATGMLIYTLINSPGFFAQRRQWPMVVMFAVLLVLATVSLVLAVI